MTSRESTPARKKKGKTCNSTWKPETTPKSQGEVMYLTEQCLKWLKTKMDHDVPSVVPSLTPFIHTPAPDTTAGRIKLSDACYEFLPPYPPVTVTCVFCKQDIQQMVPHYWKNPYTRKTWTPLCSQCYDGDTAKSRMDQ